MISCIIGGTKGIGLAIAKRLATTHDRLIVVYSSDDIARNKASELIDAEVTFLKADISTFEGIDLLAATLKDYSTIQHLVISAGFYRPNPSSAEKRKMILTKVLGNYQLLELADCIRVKSILTFSSCLVEKCTSAPLSTSVQTSVESLTKHYAQHLLGKTAVNCIRPGFTRTPMTTVDIGDDKMQMYLSSVHDKAYLEADEIAECALFLLNNENITGQVLTVDKGVSLVP